jgi:hypothetical protein
MEFIDLLVGDDLTVAWVEVGEAVAFPVHVRRHPGPSTVMR